MKIHGHEFTLNVGVIHDVENDLPAVGKVQDIYIVDGCKVLFSIKPYVTQYQPHFRAYLVYEKTDVQENFLYLSNLFIDSSVHICQSQVIRTEIFILLSYALCTL